MSPQLIHSLFTAGALLFSLAALGIALYVRRLFSTKQTTVAAVTKLRREVAEILGLQADLEERFTRFQKREGMRVARSAAERQQDLQEEAAAVLAEKAPEAGTASAKMALYRKLGVNT